MSSPLEKEWTELLDLGSPFLLGSLAAVRAWWGLHASGRTKHHHVAHHGGSFEAGAGTFSYAACTYSKKKGRACKNAHNILLMMSNAYAEKLQEGSVRE